METASLGPAEVNNHVSFASDHKLSAADHTIGLINYILRINE
jgi:hypothetical protein